MITKSAKDPVTAIKFANLFFKEEFVSLFWAGPKEGSEDTLGRKGWYLNADKVKVYDFPDGIKSTFDYINVLSPINGSNLGIGYSGPLFEKANNVTMATSEQEKWWRESMDKQVVPSLVEKYPNVYLTAEQSNKRNELLTPLSDYAKMMEAKFIIGDEVLTDANIAKYFNEMKKLGAETYVKIYQDAYDGYMKNKTAKK